MDNVNITIAANILKFRKKCGMTQEELAGCLNVSFQAVSKWENAKALPDISFLPMMADLFNCHIDELFSREVNADTHCDLCTELPWSDDDRIRGVVCLGKKILQKTDDLVDKFTFEIVGDTKAVQTECNLVVNGNVRGGANCGGAMKVEGHFSGGTNCNGDLAVGGNFSGGANCRGGLAVGGNFSGDINAKTITVTGNVKAEKIEGDVVCKELECDLVKGNVTIENKTAP